MNATQSGCVTLDEVFAAAAARAASLVPETSGYLALAVGDATSRLPFAIEDRSVMLTTEGNVGITKRGELLPPRQAARGLREALARLLAVSTGTAMPGLSSAARPREESDRGVEAVVEEIEAALIPVNRAAARRALARLARETIKAKEHGRLKPRPTTARPPAEAPKGVAAAPPAAPAPQRAPEAHDAPIESRSSTPEPPRAAPLPQAPVEPREQAVARPAPTPRPAPAEVAAPPPIVAVAKTPPPAEAAEVVVAVAPPAPMEPAPAEEREPTPTVLGMAPVMLDEDALPHQIHGEATGEAGADATPIDAVEVEIEPRAEIAQAADPQIDDIVLAQPSEAPEIAFELDFEVRRGPRAAPDPITPPFALAAQPAPAAPPAPARVIPAPPARATVPTRADDLLARFGASCVDDGMNEATACLRRIAGIDPTPPPARVEIRVPPPPAPVQAAPLPTYPSDGETPAAPRAGARRGRSSLSTGVTLFVLIAGIAGGGALVRLRPELFGVLARPAEPGPAAQPTAEPAAPRKDPPPRAAEPAVSAQPTGTLVPGWADRLGGTRAERGGTERAR